VARGSQSILQVQTLAQFPWLVHGFSTRCGGVSSLELPSAPTTTRGSDLNLGMVPCDNPANVEENRRCLLDQLRAQKMHLVVLNQIHSDLVRILDDTAFPRNGLCGDGLLTDRQGRLLSILTADCLPILLVDARQRVVAAIHSGWRGTVLRIAQKAVGLMKQRFLSRDGDLWAAIGPGIRACCYIVGKEVADEFTSQFLYADELLASHKEVSLVEKKFPLLFGSRVRGVASIGNEQRTRLDLVRANLHQLVESGVAPENIYADAPCTSCHPKMFFSYRRDGSRTGRMMAVIGIRK
jgi:YfiH family protein